MSETEYMRTRIRRAAGLLALENSADGLTPDGMTVKQHADMLERYALQQVSGLVLTGTAWIEAAEQITHTLRCLAEPTKEKA
ncbi:hypothetical protein DFO66_103322 [Brevibacterium sanguinis]|uniref:Uncharacterized protein n=2 Tax=Brevibacterium TaxID=1696 RepID=A0A366ING4_9MICO|nr:MULTISPECIES: hypothetical protein [Brevibacterium]RBP66375.1 hypothetical protein DFO66_103322 [Brevibacterium sanguinis]RBP73026.1 hypothetical protein DFO65_103321 [Brevibacterium celere]